MNTSHRIIDVLGLAAIGALLALVFCGCAVVHSTQRDISPNEREITTKVTGYALFSSTQTLQKLSAKTTDKTQDFGLAGLGQQGATNSAATISALAELIKAMRTP